MMRKRRRRQIKKPRNLFDGFFDRIFDNETEDMHREVLADAIGARDCLFLQTIK